MKIENQCRCAKCDGSLSIGMKLGKDSYVVFVVEPCKNCMLEEYRRYRREIHNEERGKEEKP